MAGRDLASNPKPSKVMTLDADLPQSGVENENLLDDFQGASTA